MRLLGPSAYGTDDSAFFNFRGSLPVFGQRVDRLVEGVEIVEHEPVSDARVRVGNGSKLLWNSDRRQRI